MIDRVQFVNEMKRALDLPESYNIDIEEPVCPVTTYDILDPDGFDLELGEQVFHFNMRNNPKLFEQISKNGFIPEIVRNEVISGLLEEEKRRRVEEARRLAEARGEFSVKGVPFKMIRVEGGIFQMGKDDQGTVHRVQLSSFYIGQTEVTQELWKAVMGYNPSYFIGNKKPVEQVSWDDCQTFIRKLNSLTGKKFRLPTEAEWEFAARGGTKSKGYTYSGSNCLSAVAWYGCNSGNTTHDVATKVPNELGIYDMSGNVAEWCQDWYAPYHFSSNLVIDPMGPSSGECRVDRGGFFRVPLYVNAYDHVHSLGSRHYAFPYVKRDDFGLRLAL